ncbi:DTW domain-containing protein isoform X2 [Tasmannia lanceolata]|uniref:DTW domain-containing protein isoform X2 n=1 Tax=Tasmannia lanceolata TaxID=3420 RepID=UPI004062A8AE
MSARFLTGIRLQATLYALSFALSPLRNQHFNLYKTLTLEMGEQPRTKRPFCPSCSKPASVCLCSRIKSPPIDNSISVTILQHNHEKNHPLNSTRIANLGLKNLEIFTVSDVHFQAKFEIQSLKPDYFGYSSSSSAKTLFNSFPNYPKSSVSDRISDPLTTHKAVLGLDSINGFVKCHTQKGKLDFEQIPTSTKSNVLVFEKDPEPTNIKENMSGTVTPQMNQNCQQKSDFDLISAPEMLNAENVIARPQPVLNLTKDPYSDKMEAYPTAQAAVITAIIDKYGFVCSETHSGKPDFDRISASQIGKSAISNGFIVRKLQMNPLGDLMGSKEFEEFEILIPPGSALLFPRKNSIDIEAVDFNVKHLVVLDGTWAKAKRMYAENPWLKLLPHIKLDSREMSLYSEVRLQPKAGCLSTIESIVYAMKALGENNVGLDDLLDVFESMVGDQRRCKDERLSRESMAIPMKGSSAALFSWVKTCLHQFSIEF